MNTTHALILILLTTVLLRINFIIIPNMETAGQPIQFNFAEGNWEGDIIGQGTVMAEYDVTINATITGTLEGTPQFGTWNGKYQASYKWDSHIEDDIGFLKGNYSWNMDDSGRITGTVVSKVSGLLVGDWELQLEGCLREPGIIEGTWTGKFTPTHFSYGRVTPVPTTLKLQGSGEFEAKLQEKIITTTAESTSTTTSPTSSPIPTLQSPPSDETITHQSQILVTILQAAFIIAIVIIVIFTTVKFLRSKH